MYYVRMLSLYLAILYRLNVVVSRGMMCGGRPVPECIEHQSYAKIAQTAERLESTLLKYSERMSVRSLEKLQLKKLNRILRSASQTPFWRDKTDPESVLFRGARAMIDISALPILAREDVRVGFTSGSLVNPNIPVARRVLVRTSGSTGEPLSFYLDSILVPGRRAAFRRFIRWFSLGKPALVVKAIGAIPLGFVNFEGALFYWLRNDRDINISLADFFVYVRSLLRKTKLPIIIDTFPSNILRLTRIFEEARFDTSRVLGFIPGGETLLPGEREYLEQKFQLRASGKYVSTEFEVIGQECGESPQHAYHVNAEYFYVEIVDTAGNPVPRGNTGRVVITSLDQEVMPFLRYDTGDVGRWVEDSCPCGRTLPLLVVEGRHSHLINLPNGRAFTQFNIISVFFYPMFVSVIRQFQVIHEKPSEFVMKIVPHSTITEDVSRELQTQLVKLMGSGVSIKIQVVENISYTARGKRMGYVSNF